MVAMDGALMNYRAAQWLRSMAPRATIAARCDNWPGLLLAVKSGAGLTPMPVADGDRDSELVRVIDDIPELLTAHYLLTHRDLQPPACAHSSISLPRRSKLFGRCYRDKPMGRKLR